MNIQEQIKILREGTIGDLVQNFGQNVLFELADSMESLSAEGRIKIVRCAPLVII